MEMAAPTETKVTVAGLASTVTAFFMTWLALNWTAFPDKLSEPVAALVFAAVTGSLTFGASWWAKHTNRTDAEAAKGKHV